MSYGDYKRVAIVLMAPATLWMVGFVIVMLLLLVLGIVPGRAPTEQEMMDINENYGMFIPLTTQLIYLFLVVYFMRSEGRGFESIGFKRDNFLKAILIGVATFIALKTLFLILPSPDGFPRPKSHIALAASILALPIGGGFIEEIMWRGYALHRLIEMTGKRYLAILFTSLSFGFWHLPFGLLYVVYTFIIGVVLASIVILTKNIVSSITAHMLANIAGILAWIM